MIEKELIVMVGPIGSGKTTFSKTLMTDSSIRISQDEMGKKGHMKEFEDAIANNVPRIIIDRMNFNKDQRARYIEPAKKAGYVITIFDFKVCPIVCTDRVVKRKDHPTIPEGDYKLAIEIRQFYNSNYEAPTPAEYVNYNEVKDERT